MQTRQQELYSLIADIHALTQNICSYANASAEIPDAHTADLETGRAALNEIYFTMFNAFEGQEVRRA